MKSKSKKLKIRFTFLLSNIFKLGQKTEVKEFNYSNIKFGPSVVKPRVKTPWATFIPTSYNNIYDMGMKLLKS